MNAITIKDLYKTYETKKGKIEALKGVSFSVKQGEFFGLLGPNGAGKSTLINILAGVSQKTTGRAEVLGKDIDEDPSFVKKTIGVVPQELAFEAFFNLNLSLRFQFGYYGLSVDEDYLSDILDRLSLKDKVDARPRELSGGMKRRLMIARALIHKPEVLILDEPTAGVDVELRHDLYDLVRELNKQGTTIVLTSHYLEEVELLCERVGIIHKGNMVALDTKHGLKDRFQTTRQLSIALSKPLKEIPLSLSGFAPEQRDAELLLTFEEGEYDKVLKAVANADLPLLHFRVIEPTLEDVFLEFTK